MLIIRNRILPIAGFWAINLMGVVFVRREIKVGEEVSQREWITLLRHERIHTRQMWELLIVGFYAWYVLEWLVRWAMYRNARWAYFNISFEREAYAHQSHRLYHRHRKPYAFLKYLKGKA